LTDKTNKRVSAALPRSAASSSAGFRVHPDFDPSNRLDGVRRLAPHEEFGPEIEVCVANGRTVHMPSATGQKRIVGYDVTAQQNIFALVQEIHQPGTRITLKESEANRLMDLGFVCRPEDYTPPPPPKEERTINPGIVERDR
jgi:hypothetical protein